MAVGLIKLIMRRRSAVSQVQMSDQSTTMATALPMADILPIVLQYLSRDLASLCACALVDRHSNRAASAVLYRNIVFSPPWTAALDLNEAQKYSVRSHCTTVVLEVDIHCIPATGNYTALRRTPSLCRLCKDCRNRGYGRFKTRKGGFKSN